MWSPKTGTTSRRWRAKAGKKLPADRPRRPSTLGLLSAVAPGPPSANNPLIRYPVSRVSLELCLEPHVGSLVSFARPDVGGAGNQRRIVEMRSRLLLGAAALLAGVGLATAQNMPGGGQSAPAQHQGAQSQGAQGGAAGQDRERGRAGQAQQGAQGQGKQGQAQQGSQGQSKQGQETGQAPQREQA